MNLDCVLARGQTYIVSPNRIWDCPEVLYRTRDPHHADAMQEALDRAWDRGVEEATRGWPETPAKTSPIFETGQQDTGGYVVMEHHPRLPWADRKLYETSSEADASLALAAVRRAATLGAMSVKRSQPHKEPDQNVGRTEEAD